MACKKLVINLPAKQLKYQMHKSSMLDNAGGMLERINIMGKADLHIGSFIVPILWLLFHLPP